MLKYLTILLADDVVSYCHYERKSLSGDLIPLKTLQDAIVWSMKENLNIQFVYPDWIIPDEYKSLIHSVDHTNIVSSCCKDEELVNLADVISFDDLNAVAESNSISGKICVVRVLKEDLLEQEQMLKLILAKANRLVVIIKDIDKFSEQDFKRYTLLLDSLIPVVKQEYFKNHIVHFNLLTDRIMLDEMNNCNAGWESITLAPNGKFYVCPGFYLDDDMSIGSVDNGLNIKNARLYQLGFAPICRNCDAFQCKRCVWLNKKTTLEINTPSHEQCVTAHIERNASKKLLDTSLGSIAFSIDKTINEISYLDPFELITNK